MNNYMARFPAWNHSSGFPASSSLEPFQLLGEEAPAPHGVCNMGVLLLDSAALAALLAQLSDHRAMRALELHVQDRFLDSLWFVVAVHRAGIRVLPLSGDLNHFVLLEEEVQEAAAAGLCPPPAPRLAHFMADSSLEVLPPRPDSDSDLGSACQCLLRRDQPFSASSLISAMIAERCPALCQYLYPSTPPSAPVSVPPSAPGDGGVMSGEEEGDMMSHTQTSLDTHNNSGSGSGSAEAFLQVLWPEQGVTLFSSLGKFSVHVMVRHQQHSAPASGSISLRFSHIDTFSVRSLHTTCDEAAGSCESAVYLEGMISPADRRDHILAMTMTVSLAVTATAPGAGGGGAAAETALSLHDQEVGLRVVSRDRLPPSHVGFSNLHQRSSSPHSLASQQQLAHLLNLRGLHGVGVVLCCDTAEGLQTARHLIREFGHRIELDRRLHMGGLDDGRLLVIALQGSSSSSHPLGTPRLAAELRAECDSRVVHRRDSGLGKEHLLGCVLVQDAEVLPVVAEHIRRNRAGSLSFVYTDVFTSHASYTRSLQEWFPVLSTGGVLAGSRYHTPLREEAPQQQQQYMSWETSTAMRVRNAVDACAHAWSVPVFATYFEITQQQQQHDQEADATGTTDMDDMFVDALPLPREGVEEEEEGGGTGGRGGPQPPPLPAWYLFNNHRV
jgi:hypothetical protein